MLPPTFASIVAGVFVLAVGAASAQDYPTRPIRLVNPFAPGGSTEVVVRTLSQRLGEALGQPVVVDARPGAGTNLASEIVAKAPPDGYTMLNATSSIAINVSLYTRLGFDPVKDLTPVILLVQSPNALGVNAALPVQTVQQLVDYARVNPGKLNYGSSGNGATNHLSMELLKSITRVDMVHVPYKGGAQVVSDLLAGQVQVAILQPSTLMPHHKSGRIRIIAVGSSQRVEGLDIATIGETIPGFESAAWYALFVPAGTPRSIVTRLNGDVERMLRDRAVAQLFAANGLVPVGGTPEALGAYLRREIDTWGKVVKASGAKVD